MTLGVVRQYHRNMTQFLLTLAFVAVPWVVLSIPIAHAWEGRGRDDFWTIIVFTVIATLAFQMAWAQAGRLL